MRSTREINRLLVGVLAAFAAITLAAAYWATFGPDTILQRADNPRLVEAEASIIRGDIVDRAGKVLATSDATQDGNIIRQYSYPETSSVLGYFSLRYGVGGVEAAYNTILRGDNLSGNFTSNILAQLLHRQQEGAAIKLTLDLNIQQQIVQAMNGYPGAVIVLGVPDGEVLGLASLPTYDPNTLDSDWETLVQAPGNPFFNRALQGKYQPGGTLETPLLAAALLGKLPLEIITDNATNPLRLSNVELTCAVRLPFSQLTLRDAYAFACPQPFAELAQALGPQMMAQTLNMFHFNAPIHEVFTSQPAGDTPTASVPLDSITEDNLIENALGQGQLTVTPLEMVVMAAAIINDGNAPPPFMLVGTRAPDAEEWVPAQAVRPTIPYTNANIARQLQDLMRNAVANGAAANAGRANIDIGGHATLAYSGQESQAWFVGFATIAGRQAIAVAVVLDNSNDPGLAADIGGTALAAAHEVLQQK